LVNGILFPGDCARVLLRRKAEKSREKRRGEKEIDDDCR
jgi:hypothetical protein